MQKVVLSWRDISELLCAAFTRRKKDPPLYLLNGGKAIVTALKAWIKEDDVSMTSRRQLLLWFNTLRFQ